MNLELSKAGTVLIHDGQISLGGFEGENCGCSDVAILALIWAIGELQRELTECLRTPGGSGKCGIDLPQEVEKALGIEDDFHPEFFLLRRQNSESNDV